MPKRIDEEKCKECEDLLKQGFNLADTANKTGVSQGFIANSPGKINLNKAKKEAANKIFENTDKLNEGVNISDFKITNKDSNQKNKFNKLPEQEKRIILIKISILSQLGLNEAVINKKLGFPEKSQTLNSWKRSCDNVKDSLEMGGKKALEALGRQKVEGGDKGFICKNVAEYAFDLYEKKHLSGKPSTEIKKKEKQCCQSYLSKNDFNRVLEAVERMLEEKDKKRLEFHKAEMECLKQFWGDIKNNKNK